MSRLIRAPAVWGALALAHAALAADVPLPQQSPDGSMGVANCTSSLCHGSTQRWTDSHVMQNEYLAWSRNDKHARAYAVLLEDRSKEIARKLGLPEPAHLTGLCLDCHAHNVPATRRGPKFVLSDGVTCEACHGPAQRWIRSHVEPQATHAQNRANGLYPMPDDVQRARLCLSCHFGNSEKFVDHRMLAAGHPRLSFELDTFSQLGPVHFHIDEDWVQRKGSWDGTRGWAVGQAVAATELLKTLVDPKRGRTGLFPELALFDCHACHHPMSEKRDIAARLDLGPGWVRLNDSSLFMLRQIAARVDAGGAARFNTQVDRLRRAIAGGEDSLVQARATMQECGQMLTRILAHERFNVEDLRAMLDAMLEHGLAGHYGDYQSAEQATMAVQSMTNLLSRSGVLRAETMQPAMSRLLESVADDERFRPEAFRSALHEVRTALHAEAKR